MLGILSLVLWSLVLVVSVKYLVSLLKADNHGEGGLLALVRDDRIRSALHSVRPLAELPQSLA